VGMSGKAAGAAFFHPLHRSGSVEVEGRALTRPTTISSHELTFDNRER
jgi:hypothetical protein